MSREKQIEEMAKVLCKHFGTDRCEDCWNYNMCPASRNAEKFYNAGYRKQEWISVDERLPDDEVKKYQIECNNPDKYYPCLVHHTLDGTTISRVCEAYYKDGRFVTKDYYVLNRLPDCITHWMPLPEAPKMKGGD